MQLPLLVVQHDNLLRPTRWHEPHAALNGRRLDAGGYERFDSESDSDDDEDDMLMVFGELRPYKQTKLVR